MGEEIECEVRWFQSSSTQVVCPICTKHVLTQMMSVIMCECGFRLDVKDDACVLDSLQSNLHQAVVGHDAHAAKDLTGGLEMELGEHVATPGCDAPLRFSVRDRFGA